MRDDIHWIETSTPQTLVARGDLLTENDMDPIQDWCRDHNCGVRTSFDTFKFKNKKEMVLFLLRWGNGNL